MMRQQTLQKMADREVDKVKAMSESEKERYNLEHAKKLKKEGDIE